MSSAKLSAARLVEQLQLTNERLERLEAEIRHANSLHAQATARANADPEAPVGDQTGPNGRVPGSASTPVSVAGNGTSQTGIGDNSAVLSQSSSTPATGKSSASGPTQRPTVTAAQVEGYFRRADVLFQSGKPDAAVKVWRQLLEVQPENRWALTNIGIVYTDQGRWAEAFDIFTEVARLEPNSLEAHYGLGLVHAQQGDYVAAAAEWEYVLRIQPDNEDARVNLSIVKERMALENEGADRSRSAAGGASTATPDEHAASAPPSRPVEQARSVQTPSVFESAPIQAETISSMPESEPAESAAVRRALAAKAKSDDQNRSRPANRSGAGRYALGLCALAAIGGAAWFLVPRSHAPTAAVNTEQVAPAVHNTKALASNSSVVPSIPPAPKKSDPAAVVPLPPHETATVRATPSVARLNRPALQKRTHWPVNASTATGHSIARRSHFAHRSRPIAQRPRPAAKKAARSDFNQGIDKLVNQIP